MPACVMCNVMCIIVTELTVPWHLCCCRCCHMQCPALYPRWILDATAALDSCRAASTFTSCPNTAPISMIGNTDGGDTTPLLGCTAGTLCPASAPTNAVPSTDAYTFYSLNAAGAVVECRPASTTPANTCTGRVPVVNAAGTVLGCTQSSSCPTSFYQLYTTTSALDTTAVLSSCVATAPNCATTPGYPTPVYDATLGTTTPTLAGCKATAASCPTAYPVMTLSATSVANKSPAIEGCYKSYAAAATCPSTGTYTIPVCSSSNVIASSCSGTNVHGCLAATSTRCFSNGRDGNIQPSYRFIVASLTTSGNPAVSTLGALSACYQPPPTNSPTCTPASPLVTLPAFLGTGAPGGCISMDIAATGTCTPWWKDYNLNTDALASCSA
jgi:hypothetical protein